MSFWEALALVSAAATILGVFLAGHAMVNNRTLKQEAANTREMIQREVANTREMIQQEAANTRAMLTVESANTREILGKFEQGQEEARREAAEARKEMAEANRYLAELIRGEGERTRQAIRASS